MKIFETLFAKLKAIVHGVAEDVHAVADKVAERVEDVREKIAQHFDIPADVVAARLDEKAANDPQKLKWRTSIVDLLKLLEMDSSLQARKALAGEFNPDYGREFDGHPEQNIWLHRQVMAEIAKRGIRIPQPE